MPALRTERVTVTDPVVLVTGAQAGIGRATAMLFAKHGAIVVASGRHPGDGEQLVAQLRVHGSRDAAFFEADVRHDAALEALVDKTVERFGRLDVAVNNAGTEGHPGPIAEQTANSYAATFDTNVLGTLLSMKHELRVMREMGAGSIINVSSIYGCKGLADASVYVASKHAVIGLTKSAALEAAPFGVRVNAIAPGFIDTAMFTRVTGTDNAKARLVSTVPQRRAGNPEEVAQMIVFMAGPGASYLTGQTIFLDGGITTT